MTTTIQPAGYIVIGYDLIHGIGATADAAWADALRNLGEAGIDVDTAPAAGCLTIHPATAALMAEVDVMGGARGWRTIDGICCTRDEAEAAA